MIARHADERHIARGYDPYNSADQPWVMQLSHLKRNMKWAEEGLPPEPLRCTDGPVEQCPACAHLLVRHVRRVPSDAEIDAKMRRELQFLERNPSMFQEYADLLKRLI